MKIKKHIPTTKYIVHGFLSSATTPYTKRCTPFKQLHQLTEESKNTYDYTCFSKLVYEFDFSDIKETERKIKRSLRYYQLGEYDQERVDYIRKLKNDLYSEISQQTKSKYFNKSKSNYADLEDFNFNKMLSDYSKKYDRITKTDLSQMLNFSIYLYHMR